MHRLLTSVALCAALTFCGACAPKSDATKTANEPATMKKTLVAYFSATGTTRAAAERLAGELGADLFEIVPGQPYTDADLDWRDSLSRSSVEMRDRSSRPAIAARCADIAGYDTVWVGFPIWWYTAPTIVNTFVEAHDLGGKVVNVFATSGGSGVEGAAADLAKAYPALTWGESRLMN